MIVTSREEAGIILFLLWIRFKLQAFRFFSFMTALTVGIILCDYLAITYI